MKRKSNNRNQSIKVLGRWSGVLFLTVGSIPAAYASPQGGQVVSGEGNIQQPDSQSTVINQNSQSMVVNWDSFNVNSDEHVRFVQPSTSASVLNRIMDQNPSQIFGTIDANGRVFLINPNGIVFGESSAVNVGSLVASALNIDPDAFMKGDYKFSAVDGEEGGLVVNRGVIQAASGGSVSLIGGAVSNEGVIVAKLGKINMGAGHSVVLDFDGDGLMRFEVDGEIINNTSQLSAAVSNTGQLSADGGEILLSAKAAQNVFDQIINNEGVIKATRIEHQGGVIKLVGDGGEVRHSGVIDASGSGADETGGHVEILGDQVTLAGSSRTDVSGSHGGGSALIGGDYQGQGDTKTATKTTVSEDSTINADATENGDGGKVVVWADDTTEFHGRISAKGGAYGGNGGTAEVSGKKGLFYTGITDLTALQGETGDLLLDPGQWNICDSVNDGGCADGTNTISDATLSAQVQAANTTLSTATAGDSANEDIIVNTGANVTWTNSNSLTLSAGRNITNNGGTFTAASGTLNLDVGQNGAGGILDMTSGSVSGVGNVNASGGAGTDTLIGANTANTWSITGTDAGNLNGAISFTNIENLTGGSNTDNYVFSDGQGVSGTIDGGSGANTLDYSGYTTGVTVDLANNTATGAGGIGNITVVDGGSATDTLIGANTANTWNITGNNAGNINSTVTFTGIENLNGGSASDSYVFSDGQGVSGTVDGGAGSNTLDYSAYSTGVTVDLANNTATGVGGISNISAVDGGAASDTLIGANTTNTWNMTDANAGNINGTFSFTGIETLTGGSASDTLAGADTANTWNITGTDAGNVNGALAFSGIENLNGGSASDTYVFSDGQGVSGTIDGGAGSNTLDYSAYSTGVTVDLANNTATGVGGISNISAVDGGAASDTLIGANTTNTWNMTGANAGNINGTFSFTGIETLTGGSASDTLAGADTANTWNITGTDAGNVNGALAFSGIENLNGGSASDTYVFSDGQSVSGTIDGGAGSNTLDYSAYTTGVMVDLATNTATGTGGINNITAVNGGSATDTLIGADTANTWNITGNNAGNINSIVAFTGIENLTGGSDSDNYVLSDGQGVSGTIDGGNGNNKLDYSAYTAGVTINLANNTATGTNGISNINAVDGGAASDTLIGANTVNTWNITGNNAGNINGTFEFTAMENLTGGSATDTLVGANTTNTWNITGNNAGNINAALGFTGMENLTGGTGTDSYVFSDGQGVNGTVDGGAGSNTLDYSNYTVGVTINLANNTATGTGGINNINAVAGGTSTDTLIGTNAANTWNITGNNAGDINGTVAFTNVENLTGGGDSDHYVFNDGQGVSGTVNGGAGYNTLDYSAYSTGINVNLANNTATGTGGIGNINAVIGGAASDTLIAANTANTWNITGNSAGDINGTFAFTGMENLTGGGGSDTYVFSDGRSISGTIDGGGGTNKLDYTAYSTAVTVNLASNTATAVGDFNNIAEVTGGIATDTLIGGNTANTWNITGNDAGDINGVFAFTSMENLSGGSGTDSYVFSDGRGVSGAIDGGGGNNTLDYSSYTSARNIVLTGADANGFAGTEASVGNGFSNINDIAGGSSNDTLTGLNAGSTWTIGSNSQYVSTRTLAFSGIETLNGGSGVDTFTINTNYGGTVNGGAGADVFNINNTMTGGLNGGAGNDTFRLSDDVTVGSLDGGADTDTLIAPNVINSWNITGANAGTITTSVGSGADIAQSFVSMENLTGGAAMDTFNFSAGGVDGKVSGGDGNDKFVLSSDANVIDISGDAGYDTVNVNNNITVANDMNIDLGDGEISATGNINSTSGDVNLRASTITVSSVTANNITLDAINGNLNLGQLHADKDAMLTVHDNHNIVNQNNGYIAANQLFVNLGSGTMGSVTAPFELQIITRTDFGNLSPSDLQSRVFITDTSFTGALSSGIIYGVGSVLAQASTGLSAVTRELNIVDPSIFLTEINLFSVEDNGIKLPAEQEAE